MKAKIINALIRFFVLAFNKFKVIALYVCRELFIFSPFYILLIFAYQYVMFSFQNKIINDQYKILFAIIGITATFSGLAFRASTSSDNSLNKKIFYDQAQRLFHATILFSMTIVLTYISIDSHKWPMFNLISKYINIIYIIKIICLLLSQFFFMCGIMYICLSLSILNKILFDKKLLP